ncbi:MAG: sodium:proton antiporter [Burkholderiales bacterium]
MNANWVLAIAAIGALGALCQWIGWRIRIPAIFFLLLSGIAVGPIGGWLDPDRLFGQLLLPLVSLAVAVILFEGALTLRFSEIRGLESVIRRMVTSGVLVSWLVIAAAAHWLAGLSWELSTLLGAILTVTGPTVIAPMMRIVRPTERIASILRWEGIVVDPLGALLAVLVFEYIVSAEGRLPFGQTLRTFLGTVAAGGGFGIVAGYLVGEALKRDWIPEFLDNLVTLTAVFVVFALSNSIAHESGLLAVTVMGIFLANRAGVPVTDLQEFKESLSLLLISGVFILLAARLDIAKLHDLGGGALLFLLAIQFVARPLKVLVCALGSTLNWRERTLLSWIAPRGIVAAAVSSLFALQLEQRGLPQADLLVPLAFAVIIGTVVLQSMTAAPLARALGVSEPEPNGFLIIGANALARAIGAALTEHGVLVLLADPNWDHVRQARRMGMRAYYGNPLSEHAELALDLAGLGRLLALSGDAHVDALACMRYRREFGARKVYSLQADANGDSLSPAATSAANAFGDDATYADLAATMARGGTIRTFKFEGPDEFVAFQARHAGQVTPLFTIGPKERVGVFTGGTQIEPVSGGSVIALVGSGFAGDDPDRDEADPRG